MAHATLIIHGWSDNSRSFVNLKKFLVNQGIGDVSSVYYGDYQSREDNITFEDLADGLNDQLIARGFITKAGRKRRDLNVIVHSTGGLVIRHWLWHYYIRRGRSADECPVRRIVMLAPANFGSPLAHKGKSFIGGFFKGRLDLDNFLEVGRHLLDGLELASPYQWALAHHDLLIDKPLYGPGKIQVTVMVGLDTYRGMRGLVNKPGTDGTVVIAGTSLNPVKFVLDCCSPRSGRSTPYTWKHTQADCVTAFGVLPGLNHGSIVNDVSKARWKPVGRFMLRALRASPMEFRALRDDLARTTKQTYKNASASKGEKYQQFHVRAVDDHDQPVLDYTIEFSVVRESRINRGLAAGKRDRTERKWSGKAHALFCDDFHTHQKDPSHRRFLVAPTKVKALLTKAEVELGEKPQLSMRVHVPRIDRGITYDADRLQDIALVSSKKGAPTFLFPNTTTLLELRINRRTTYFTIDTKPHA